MSYKRIQDKFIVFETKVFEMKVYKILPMKKDFKFEYSYWQTKKQVYEYKKKIIITIKWLNETYN